MQSSGRCMFVLLIVTLCLVWTKNAFSQNTSGNVTFLTPISLLKEHQILTYSVRDYLEQNTSLSYEYLEIPLARAHLDLPGLKNHCMFAISREAVREDLLQWVVPTVNASFGLYKTDVNTQSNTNDVPLVWLGSEEETVAKSLGIEATPVKHRTIIHKMLVRGRAQYFITVDYVADTFKRDNPDLGVTKVKTLLNKSFWLTCSKTTDPIVIEQLKVAWIKGIDSGKIVDLYSQVGLLNALAKMP